MLDNFPKVFFAIFALSLLVLMVLLPLFASRMPIPSRHPPGGVIIYVVMWSIALTPAFFVVGLLLGFIYQYPSWKAEQVKKNEEQERERERIRARFTGGERGDRTFRVYDYRIDGVTRPEKAVTRKPRLERRFENLRRSGRARRQPRNGNGREDNEGVLWNMEEYELSERASNAEAIQDQEEFEEVDLDIDFRDSTVGQSMV